MSKFQRILEAFLNEQRVFAAQIAGSIVSVQIKKIDDDHVTLISSPGTRRYDLHFSEVVIVSEAS